MRGTIISPRAMRRRSEAKRITIYAVSDYGKGKGSSNTDWSAQYELQVTGKRAKN
jgi:hypothetical protein